jgi:hypothetical protein
MGPHVEPSADGRWLRGGIAFVWLATGLGVLHPYYRALGLEFLAPTGLPDWVMGATCAAEVALGLRVLFGPATTAVVALQAALILGFTAILTVTQPRLWLDPLGVLPENLPLLALLATVWCLRREGWTRRARGWLRGAVAVFWLSRTAVGFVNGEHPLLIAAEVLAAALAAVAGGRLLLAGLAAQGAALLALLGWHTWHDPQLWVHPFGPLTKQVPVLVATWRLAGLEWRQTGVRPPPVGTPGGRGP